MNNFNLGFVILGCVGGLLPDLLRFMKMKYKSDFPYYLKNGQFWIGFVSQIIVGGLMSWALGANKTIDALIYGYAAPQLISILVGNATSSLSVPSKGKKQFSLRDWLSFQN